MKDKQKEKELIVLERWEVRSILFWLREEANLKWVSGSYPLIEVVYNRLNSHLGYVQTPKRWKWLGGIWAGQMNPKIKEWHGLVVTGLNNGLTHTIHDGRDKDIKWVRGRMMLYESFARCVMNLETDQDYSYDEKTLKEVAEEGYKRGAKANDES